MYQDPYDHLQIHLFSTDDGCEKPSYHSMSLFTFRPGFVKGLPNRTWSHARRIWTSGQATEGPVKRFAFNGKTDWQPVEGHFQPVRPSWIRLSVGSLADGRLD